MLTVDIKNTVKADFINYLPENCKFNVIIKSGIIDNAVLLKLCLKNQSIFCLLATIWLSLKHFLSHYLCYLPFFNYELVFNTDSLFWQAS